MMPSSCASTSIAALSVSTERRTSPAANESPSFTFHSEMLPSVMVGDCARMSFTMSAETPLMRRYGAGVTTHHGRHQKAGLGGEEAGGMNCASSGEQGAKLSVRPAHTGPQSLWTQGV